MNGTPEELAQAVATARSETDVAACEAVDAAGWDRAVSAWDTALDGLTASVAATAQGLILDSAARARLNRAWAGGPPSDLDAAVALWRRAADVMPAGAAQRYAVLNNLGVAWRDVWERDADPAALHCAVAAGDEAVASAPGVREGVSTRLELGRSLRARFADARRPEDLSAAIAVLTAATSAAQRGRDAECHEALGNALCDRYGLGGAAVDQALAIDHLRTAVELAGDEDPDSQAYRSNLASALLERFESGGARADLDEAVLLLETALAGPEAPSSLLLANFGNALRLRSVLDGSVDDIEDATDLLTRSVEVEVEGAGAQRPGLLSNLASCLLQRFDLTGGIADVDRAVDALDEAVAATQAQDPTRAPRLSNLGIALRTRDLRRRGGRADLDRAVAAFEEALALTSDEQPAAPAQHANLANVLHQRYDVTEDAGDLDRAVREQEVALSLIPEVSPDRASYLNNLAATLAARAARPGGSAGDLSRAVALAGDAVRLCAESSSLRATFLVNLANAASERFVRLGDRGDLITGRDAYRSAVTTGLALSPAEALAAAHNWSEWARDRRDWPEVTEAVRGGEQAAQHLFRSQLLRADKESWLRDAEGLAADGAYAHAAQAQPREAVMVLERGRAQLVWDALDRAEADLECIGERRGDLVERYRSAAARAS